MWKILSGALGAALLSMVSLTSAATPINLSEFDVVSGNIDFFDGGFRAVLTEDDFFNANFIHQLENNPFTGAEQLVVPEAGGELSFDYNFEGLNGFGDILDIFAFQIFGEDTTMAIPDFDFTTAGEASSGTVSFDLSALAGQTVGARFILTINPLDIPFPFSNNVDTVLTISNLQVTPGSTPAVSEPGTLALFALPMLLLLWRRKK